MDASALIDTLERNSNTIGGLVGLQPPELVRWKPVPGRWCILEVINHLYNEEREDFRARLDLLLHKPDESWPGIDPVGWVTLRDYMSKDPEETLKNFLEERKKSVRWLRELDSPAWNNVYNHPVLGTISAGDLLASWVAHDFLHIRQLARLHWEYVSHISVPHGVEYAGNW